MRVAPYLFPKTLNGHNILTVTCATMRLFWRGKMRTRVALVGMIGLVVLLSQTRILARSQQNTAQTELPGKGPCTNFPQRFQNLESRLAWFYGCMHKDPPTPGQIKARIATLAPERRAAIAKLDNLNQEVAYGVAFGDLPIQIYPNKE
jgi:hypothetical protein